MSRRLLISALPGERRAALLEDTRLVELSIQRDDRPCLLGNLYLGRVTAVDRPRGLAFVALGLERDAVLPLSEASDRKLSEGDALVVRLLREPETGGDHPKGARVTARLSAPPPDLDELVKAAKAPALLTHGNDPLDALIEASRLPDEILIDDLDGFAALKTRLNQVAPELEQRLRLDRETMPLFEREGVEEQIEALLLPTVPLPSGGSLLIEPVQSLTAVDVNSGSHVAGGGPDDLALAVNSEAARVLARQIRLRGLSGLIVVDFLALKEAGRKKAVVAALRRGLKGDREPHRVGPMAPSGLVEVTRRRGRLPLHELLTRPTGEAGSGRTKDPVTLAFDALRRLAREAAANPSRSLRIEADAAVAAALRGPAGPALASLQRRFGREIAVIARPAEPLDPYDIVID